MRHPFLRAGRQYVLFAALLLLFPRLGLFKVGLGVFVPVSFSFAHAGFYGRSVIYGKAAQFNVRTFPWLSIRTKDFSQEHIFETFSVFFFLLKLVFELKSIMKITHKEPLD